MASSITARMKEPEKAEIEVRITLPLEDWISVNAYLKAAVPNAAGRAWTLLVGIKNAVDTVIGRAEQTFKEPLIDREQGT